MKESTGQTPSFLNLWQTFSYLLCFFAIGAISTETHAWQLVNTPAIQSTNSASLIKQLLIDDWKRDQNNEMDARQVFTSTKSTTATDSLAYIINRIQHNKDREAIEVANRLTFQHPGNIDGWLLKSWLNALVNNYERSLIDLRSLKQQVDKNPRLEGPQKLAIYGRMGKLIGYMQGPVNNKVNPEILQSTIMFVAAGIQPPEMDAFNKSREGVLTRFNELTNSQGKKIEVELAKKKAENENLTVTLNTQNQLLDQSLAQLAAEIDQLRSEANRRLSDLDAQLSPLERQLISVTSQIDSIRYDLQILYTDLYYARQAPRWRRTSTFYLTEQINNLELELFSLEANATGLSDQLQLIQVQIARTRVDYEARIHQSDREFKKLNGSRKRNQIKLAKIGAGPRIADGKKGALDSRLTALTSYHALPIELYRQQVLDQLPKK